MDSEGLTRGRLVRFDAGDLPSPEDPASGWKEMERPAAHRAERLYSSELGARLFVAREGHGFLFEPVAVDSSDRRDKWRLLLESIQLLRAER
jgi:hypothetical protein